MDGLEPFLHIFEYQLFIRNRSLMNLVTSKRKHSGLTHHSLVYLLIHDIPWTF
jgi:hypothetical protein